MPSVYLVMFSTLHEGSEVDYLAESLESAVTWIRENGRSCWSDQSYGIERWVIGQAEPSDTYDRNGNRD